MPSKLTYLRIDSFQNYMKLFINPNIITIIYTLIGIYINCISQVYTQYRSIKLSSNIVLPDIGFDFFPYTNYKISDVCVYLLIILTLIRFSLGCTKDGKQTSLYILRRHLFCVGTLFFLRIFSIYCTILPNSLIGYTNDIHLSPWYEAFRILGGQTIQYGDMMFSGHAMNTTICALTWIYYSNVIPIRFIYSTYEIMGYNVQYIVVLLFILIFTIISYYFIISSRLHYTIDVYIAILLSISVFILHNVAIHTTYFAGTLFGNFISWCEKDSPDVPDALNYHEE